MKRAVLALMVLSACSQPAHPVDWFMQHPHDAATTADRCVLGRLSTSDCANAQEAMRRESEARLKLYRKGF